jgi:hypothetical protein
METAPGPEDPPPVWADADDSSFSDTGSEWEDEPLVAPVRPSSLGGEGATQSGAPRVVCPPDAPPGGPTAPALPQPPVRDPAWRTYRRSLEWRCRWVELRLRELKAQETHYAALEARLLARQAGGGSSGDAGAGGDGQAGGEGETVRVWASLLKPPFRQCASGPASSHARFTGCGSRRA